MHRIHSRLQPVKTVPAQIVGLAAAPLLAIDHREAMWCALVASDDGTLFVDPCAPYYFEKSAKRVASAFGIPLELAREILAMTALFQLFPHEENVASFLFPIGECWNPEAVVLMGLPAALTERYCDPTTVALCMKWLTCNRIERYREGPAEFVEVDRVPQKSGASCGASGETAILEAPPGATASGDDGLPTLQDAPGPSSEAIIPSELIELSFRRRPTEPGAGGCAASLRARRPSLTWSWPSRGAARGRARESSARRLEALGEALRRV